MILRLAATMAASAVLAGCSVFGDRSGTETLDYEVVADLGEDLEVRRYADRIAAEARVPGRDAGSDAFSMLFDYIKGANRESQEVAMTTPVATAEPSQGGGAKIAMTAPVQTDRATDDQGNPVTVMRFFLPAKYTAETAPVPTHQRIQLVQLPPERVAVLRFSGFGSDSSVRAEKRALMDRLEDTVWEPAGEAYAMFYDPPWTLPFLRRNEVAVPVTRAEE
jgi:hypothetical protein